MCKMFTGYPDTVSPDYAAYQVWDTVQAFASSMTSALATEAVLKSAGVGDQVCSFCSIVPIRLFSPICVRVANFMSCL